jgi:cathepsin C
MLEDCYKGCGGDNICPDNLKELDLKVSDYYYVGGHYSASTEENIMQDLVENGPLTLSFEPHASFNYYRSGVYTVTEDLNKKIINPEWYKVDHSMTLVGFGEENVNGKMVKYWLLLNSWGQNWGENGYIKFERGKNISGIESIAEAIIPLVRTKK